MCILCLIECVYVWTFVCVSCWRVMSGIIISHRGCWITSHDRLHMHWPSNTWQPRTSDLIFVCLSPAECFSCFFLSSVSVCCSVGTVEALGGAADTNLEQFMCNLRPLLARPHEYSIHPLVDLLQSPLSSLCAVRRSSPPCVVHRVGAFPKRPTVEHRANTLKIYSNLCCSRVRFRAIFLGGFLKSLPAYMNGKDLRTHTDGHTFSVRLRKSQVWMHVRVYSSMYVYMCLDCVYCHLSLAKKVCSSSLHAPARDYSNIIPVFVRVFAGVPICVKFRTFHAACAIRVFIPPGDTLSAKYFLMRKCMQINLTLPSNTIGRQTNTSRPYSQRCRWSWQFGRTCSIRSMWILEALIKTCNLTFMLR